MATIISLAALSYFVNEHKGYFLALAAKVHCCGHNIFDTSCCRRYRPLPASATAASLSMQTPCCCCPKRVVLLSTGVVGVVEVLNRRNYAKSVGVGISVYSCDNRVDMCTYKLAVARNKVGKQNQPWRIMMYKAQT